MTGREDLHERGSRAQRWVAQFAEINQPAALRAKLPQLVAFYACNCNIFGTSTRFSSSAHGGARRSDLQCKFIHGYELNFDLWTLRIIWTRTLHIFGFNIEQFRCRRNLLCCRGEFLIKIALLLRNRPATTPHVTEINSQLIFSAFVAFKSV